MWIPESCSNRQQMRIPRTLVSPARTTGRLAAVPFWANDSPQHTGASFPTERIFRAGATELSRRNVISMEMRWSHFVLALLAVIPMHAEARVKMFEPERVGHWYLSGPMQL